MTRAREAGDDEAGMALVVVLWTLLLLAVIAGSLSAEARNEGHLARNAVSLARAEAAAEAGVVQAAGAIQDPRPDHRWMADGRPYHLVLDGIAIDVRVVDEAGKIDLNAGAVELLASLMTVVGAKQQQAIEVAEAVAAMRAGAAGGQVGGFEDPRDLLGVPGMTPALFQRLEPCLTVLTRQRGVDAKSAPRPVLLALFGPDGASADGLIADREADGGSAAAAAPAGRADFLSDSQHAVYDVTAVAHVGAATYARQALVRLTHNPEMPYLVHSWRRVSDAPGR